MPRAKTQTGGRAETTGIITGDYCLSVGMPDLEPPKGWRWTKLSDLARLETGHTPARKFPEYWGGDVPWVGIRDATGNHGQTIYKTNQYTNDLGIANSSARILPKNTVCLSRTASVGYVIVMGTEMATSQDFVNWVCDPEKLDYLFLMYVLLAENRSFLRFASGTTHQTIYFPEVKAFHVCLPSLENQKSIAHILGTLDDKIELNRRMNVTLESMARALFKSWFVDFDPVIDNALAAGNPIPEPLSARAQTRRDLGTKRKPLPKNIQKLFPERFVFDEEMGWIPDGWEVDSIKNRAAAIQYGFTQSSSEEKVGPHFLRITDIRGGKVNWPSVPFCVATESEKEKYRIQDGDIFVARTGASTGENTYVVEPPDAVFASYLVRFQFVSRGLGRFVGQFMRSPSFFNHVDGILGGSAQPNASAQALASAITAFPSDAIADVFFDELRSFDLKSSGNQRQASSLAKLRDTLLPKLLSGELRIPDAEKLVAGSL